MSALVIGNPFAADLESAREQVALRNGEGAVLGMFIPATLYQSAVDRWAESVVDQNELDAAAEEAGSVSTAELVSKLRAGAGAR